MKKKKHRSHSHKHAHSSQFLIDWPKPLSEKAFQGLAGKIHKLIAPQSESDPAALLIQFLTAFGNSIGPKAYVQVESNKHHANLFSLIVGKTSTSRKGTSFGHVLNLLGLASKRWSKKRIATGLASGEGLISAVKDGRDKRLLIYEPEFSSVLRVQRREGNNLSAKIRNAWDSGTMQILTKKNPVKATGAHVSVIAHITQEELRRELTVMDQANGFANRFLFGCAKRSQKLPSGGHVDSKALEHLARELSRVREFARNVERLKRSKNAERVWSKWYIELPDNVPGMLGAITSRNAAQVTRLSMIYALLDRCQRIETRHLEAALAVWKYCDASVRYIFGTATGDPIADKILLALRKAGKKGMSKTKIRRIFSGNLDKEKTDQALQLLKENRLARPRDEETLGRTATRYFALSA